MVDFADQISVRAIVFASALQGFGVGLVFVALSTVAFATLPGHLRTSGTAILTLVRNLGRLISVRRGSPVVARMER